MSQTLIQSLKKINSLLTNIKSVHLNAKYPTESWEAKKDFEQLLVRTGSDLFNEFFQMGCQASVESISSFKNVAHSDVSCSAKVLNASLLIVDTENWMYSFLSSYPDFAIHIDEHMFIDKNVCQVRSGVQFMLDLLNDVNPKLNATLNLFKEDGLIDDFDQKLNLAKKHIEFRVKKEEVPKCIPSSHIWWF